MKKLVRESLNEEHVKNDIVKVFMITHHDQIAFAWEKKLSKIWKDYYPSDHYNQDAVDDMRAIWWNEIVEPGWEVPIISKTFGDKIYDSDVYSDISDKIIDEVLEKMKVPREIIE